MKLIPIAFLLFFSFALGWSHTLCILKENSPMEACKKDILYFIDQDSLYNEPLQVPHDLFQTNNNKTFLGHIHYPIWSKLTLKYEGDIQKSYVFVNPKVTINNLTVSVYDAQKNLIKKEILGDVNSIELRELKSRYSAFKITLNPNETITLYTQINHTGASDISWLALSLEGFENFIIKESTIVGILIGILIAIIFYNIILYARLKDNLYLLYLFHITAAFLFQIATTNLFYEFDIILGGFFPWVIASLGIASLILFAKYFFDTKKHFAKLDKIIVGMVVFCLFLSVYFTIATFYPFLMEYRKLLVFPLISLTTLLMLSVAFFALKRKLTGAIFYTLGQVGYLLCFMTPQFSNFLKAEFTFTVVYIGTFGILFDVVFLSLALSAKIKDMKEQKENQEKQLLAQARFASIGKSIATVSHQWKTPLAHISISLVNFEAYLYSNNTKDKFLQEFAKNMRESITFMSRTIDEINNFYLLSQTQKEPFALIEIIHFVKKLLEEKRSKSQAKIICQTDENQIIKSHKNILGNIFMILIDNALDMFISRKIDSPLITIRVTNHKDHLIIETQDNAGGIKIEPIEQIFDDFVSSKTSSGIGLSIAKSLVENQLHGTIDVHNKADGSLFKICCPY